MTLRASTVPWRRPASEPTTAGRVLAALVSVVAALAGAQYLAGFIFLWLIDADPSVATPLTVARYVYYHGAREDVAQLLWLSSAAGFLLIFAPATVLVIPTPRPLHGDARFATRRAMARAGLFHELGIVLGKKGLYDEAIAQLRKAIDLAPGEARGHYYLGVCLNHLDRIDEAAQAFERAIEADPNDSKSYHHLGIIWDRKGRTERAREMYRQARAVAGTTRG